MTSIAEIAGGIGIAIMMHKTRFEDELDGMSGLLKQADNTLAKIADVNGLRKSLNPSDILQKMTELVALIAEIHKQQDRCRDALPEFRAWALNEQPSYDRGATLLLVDKAADSFAGDTDAMVEHGALRRFYQPTSPTIDPAAAVSDSIIQHRSDFTRKD